MGEMLMMSGGAMFLAPILMVSAMLPVIIYVVARWRTYREGLPADPQLGLKLALAFFVQAGYQVMLLGAFMLVWALMTKGDSGTQIRAAFGLIVPGGIVFGAHVAAIQRTNYQQLPIVTRMYTGLNLLQTGAIGFVGLLLAFQALFAKGDSGDFGKMAWSLVVVYSLAWVIQGLRFVQGSMMGAPPPGVQQFAQRPGPPPGQPPMAGGPPPGTY